MANFRRKRQYYALSERRKHFLHSQWGGGVILIICSIIAIVLANIGATQDAFHHFWLQKLTIGVEGFNLSKTLEEWINDGLMVVFFFTVGLEIKREIIAGQLSTMKQAGLPIAAAVGGMVFPALIYLLFNAGTPTESGWGIPMATDIAFALGVLSLLGNRVPLSLKIFLTALAIVDDLGAILVIAIFYSTQIEWDMLIAAAATLAFLILLNRMKVYSIKYYLVPGIVLWILFLHSGIHATIAGVIIAMTLPTTPRFSKSYFRHKSQSLVKHFIYYDKPDSQVLSNEEQHECLQAIRKVARNSISPTQRLEYALHQSVTFFIMPVFALANAGVTLNIGSMADLINDESIGIFAGLVIGKPVGIFFLSWLTIKLGWCVMPKNVTWYTLFAVTCLGGIGFTMSIFIDNLAFTDPVMISTGKVAILIASLVAGFIGWAMISLASKLRRF